MESGKIGGWLRRRSLVLGGVSLLAVPTIYGMFPGLTEWGRPARLAILGAWVVVAVVATAFDTIMKERLGELMESHDDDRTEKRKLAGLQAINLMIRYPPAPPHWLRPAALHLQPPRPTPVCPCKRS